MENLEKKTKAELIQQIEAMRGANSILEGDLKEMKSDLEEARKKLKKAESGATVTTDNPAIMAELGEAKKTITELRDIIKMSCNDHCPHHGNPDACRNCEINKRMNAAIA